MSHTPFIKRSLLALSIAALSAPALVMAGSSAVTMDPPAYNQNADGSPSGHTGGATSSATMEPAGQGSTGQGMGAAGNTGTSGTGTGSGTTVIEDGASGTGTTGTGTGTGTGGTMDRSGSGSMGTGSMGTGSMGTGSMAPGSTGTGTTGADGGMGTSTGTGTYGTGTGSGAMDRDSSFETDRNAPSTTEDPMRDSRDNRNTTPDSSTGTLR